MHKKVGALALFFIILGTLSVASCSAFAQGTSRVSSGLIDATSTRNKLQTRIGISNNNYFESSRKSFAANRDSTEISTLDAAILWDRKTDRHSRLDVSGYLESRNDFYLNPKEFFVAGEDNSKEGSQLSLGRKLYQWSFADELWNLGLWQPRFRRDYFRPEQQGLTGMFYSDLREHHRFQFFASPITIPDMGPNYRVENGHLVSNNAFFHAPISSVTFRGVVTDVNYSPEIPPIENAILHPAIASQYQYRNEHSRYNISYAYKPLNQVVVAFDDALEVPSNVLHAKVIPRFLYHHLATLEWNYENSKALADFAVSADRIEKDATQTNWTSQEVKDSALVSASLGRGEWQGASAWLSLLKVWGGDDRDSGLLASDTTFFESRYSFREALQLGYRTTLFTEKLNHQTKVLYDWSQLGMWVSTDFVFKANDGWQFELSADVLGIVREGDVWDQRSFIRRYRSNDRVRGGVAYVF